MLFHSKFIQSMPQKKVLQQLNDTFAMKRSDSYHYGKQGLRNHPILMIS